MTELTEEEIIGNFLEAVVRGLRKKFPEKCRIVAFNNDFPPDPKDGPFFELDLRGWDPADKFSNAVAFAVNIDLELRILDKVRNHEKKNVSTRIRGMALKANRVIRGNVWDLAYVDEPKNIACFDDRLGVRIRQEEQWVVKWSQIVGVGEAERFPEGAY